MSDGLDSVFQGSTPIVRKQKESQRPVLVIDTAQFFFTARYTMIKQVLEHRRFDFIPEDMKEQQNPAEETFFEAVEMFNHLFVSELISVVSRFQPDHVVLAGESGSWRKKAFWDESTQTTLYKANRLKDREEDDFDWGRFFEEVGKFQEDLKEIFPFVFVKCHEAEGDDIVASVVFHLAEQDIDMDIIVVSRDKDFKQLLMKPRVKLYNQYDKKFVECENPREDLLAQILLGDSTDGIPNVRRPRDSLVLGTPCGKGEKLGEKTVWKAITEHAVEKTILVDEKTRKRFEENKLLIDLSKIPDRIQHNVVKTYLAEREKLETKSSRKLLEYLAEKRMQNLIGRFHLFEKLFKR